MERVRVIPCLDVKDGRVVKGVQFVNLRDAADPVDAAAAYSQAGADELIFLDIAATVEGRATRMDWVKRVREVATIPFGVGGGIRNVDEMRALFAIGCDKVSVNTAALANPDMVADAVREFGTERVVVAIDGRKNEPGSGRPRLEVVIKGGQEATGVDVVEWARRVEALGAGEILLTSKDADGTKNGYDLEMTKAVAEAVGIPVIASGGAGKLEHFAEAVLTGKASAVLAASVFHFGEISIPEVKRDLQAKGIPVSLR